MKVLVIDDNKMDRIRAKSVLAESCDVRTRDSWISALPLISRKWPDVIVADWLMPYTAAESATMMINALIHKFKIPVLVWTANRALVPDELSTIVFDKMSGDDLQDRVRTLASV